MIFLSFVVLWFPNVSCKAGRAYQTKSYLEPSCRRATTGSTFVDACFLAAACYLSHAQGSCYHKYQPLTCEPSSLQVLYGFLPYISSWQPLLRSTYSLAQVYMTMPTSVLPFLPPSPCLPSSLSIKRKIHLGGYGRFLTPRNILSFICE